jgi:hypothetical protein
MSLRKEDTAASVGLRQGLTTVANGGKRAAVTAVTVDSDQFFAGCVSAGMLHRTNSVNCAQAWLHVLVALLSHIRAA